MVKYAGFLQIPPLHPLDGIGDVGASGRYLRQSGHPSASSGAIPGTQNLEVAYRMRLGENFSIIWSSTKG